MNKITSKLIGISICLILLFESYINVKALAGQTLTSAAASAVYYVAPTGSDSNPGTLTAPFATVAEGLSVAQTGDTIYVRAGTYSTVDIDKSGITLSGYPNEIVKIIGRLVCYQQTNDIVENFDVSGAPAGNYNGAVEIDDCNNSTFQNIVSHDNVLEWVSGFEINNSTGDHILNNISYNSDSGIDVSSSTNIEIAGNLVYDNTIAAGNSDGISVDDPMSSGINIHNNISHDNSDDCIDTWTSSNNTIANNTVYHCGGTGDGNGIKAGGDGPGGNDIVSGNLSYNNYACGFTSNGSADTFTNNISHDNGTCGFEDFRDNGNTQISVYTNNEAWNNPINFSIANTSLVIINGDTTATPSSTTPTTTIVPTNTLTFTSTPSQTPTITPTNVLTATSTLALTPPPSITPLPTNVFTSTATQIPPTQTAVPPTATQIPPTQTAVPPTPTATQVPPTQTVVPPTPTATQIPPTQTAVPPTPTATQIPPTQTVVPPTPTATQIPPTQIVVPPTPTATHVPPTQKPATPTTQATTQPPLNEIYDDKNSAFVYSSGWRNEYNSKAYDGSYKQSDIKKILRQLWNSQAVHLVFYIQQHGALAIWIFTWMVRSLAPLTKDHPLFNFRSTGIIQVR